MSKPELKHLKAYYNLTKPGIIYGNLINATAGFLLGSPDSVDWWLLLVTLLGSSLVIASGCVFNNYLDRGIDKKMKRTKERALVTKLISVRVALTYATILGLLGFALLWRYTNWLVLVIGLVGFVDYVIIYGYAKRHTVHSTMIGAVSGATPVLAGYCAATGQIDAAAIIIFLMLVTWQMAHFYAIGMRRYKDYKAAGLPILPVKRGTHVAKIHVLVYIGLFTVLSSLLTFYGYTGYIYLVIMVDLGLIWLIRGLRMYKIDDETWGRKIFLFSLIVTLVSALMLSIGARIP